MLRSQWAAGLWLILFLLGAVLVGTVIVFAVG